MQRPPVGRWLLTGSFWVLITLGVIVAGLAITGHAFWAAPFSFPLGIALARWLVRVLAFWQPFWFRSEWLKAQGWRIGDSR